MPRPSKTEQEMGYLKDFWTEVRTMEAEYHGSFEMKVNPTGRPGVMVYKMEFTPEQLGTPGVLGVISLAFQYPNVEQSSYAGFMWRKAISLSRMVEEAEGVLNRAPKQGAAAAKR